MSSKKYRDGHKEEEKAYSKKWYEENPGARNASRNKRRAVKLLATPIWYEEHTIKGLYEISAAITRTGQKMNVDHITPLQHKKVCGLHCLANLQIITAKANLSKSNKFEIT